jgi:UDP-N-acetylglucosamine 2-epimerase (non-hydrolysing)
MKKFLVVFGTRPEAIKMAPVIMELLKHEGKVKTIVCVTGQHRSMLDQVLQIFEIKPDIDLNIMSPGQDLTDVTTRVMVGMRDVLKNEKPDLVLVHGDTTTAMATSLAAFYQQIPVGHVEAGLRTFNKYSPWPEEINRQITDRIAEYHFAPTALNKKNLLDEGVSDCRIFVTGNTVIDALFIALEKIEKNNDVQHNVEKELISSGIPAENIKHWDGILGKRRMVLITGHRRENFGNGFINICEAIKELAERNPNVDFIYPMHLNPNVREPIKILFGEALDKHKGNIFFIEPVQYLPFIWLMKKSFMVLTDSGGIQEEAPSLGKPVLVMRDTTERPEAVNAGSVKLVGTNSDTVINEVEKVLNDNKTYTQMVSAKNPFGDGYASNKILKTIIQPNE